MRPALNGANGANSSFDQVGQTPLPPGSGPNMAEVLADLEGKDIPEQLEYISSRIEVETRIKEGAEKILQLFDSGRAPGKDNLRRDVEAQLNAAQSKIIALNNLIQQIRGSPKSFRPRHKAPTLNLGAKRTPFTAHSSYVANKRRDDSSDKDDFRSVLNQARSMVKQLVAYRANYQGQAQPSPLSYTGFSPMDAPNGSSPSNAPVLMNERDLDRSRTGLMSALVSLLQKNMRIRYELVFEEVVEAIVPALADYASKESRAAAYRLIRHVIVDVESIGKLRPFGIEWYIVRSLARDNKHAVEKEQVVKLIRAHIDVGSSRRSPTAGAGSGSVPLPQSVMRALVAVAEHQEDQFRHVALETIAEIVLVDTDLVVRSDALRVLLQALVDGPPEMSCLLANAFLFLIDAPKTRAYLRPGTDLEIALTGFTDAYGKGTDHAERMTASSKVIATMLGSWSGLMYLCMNDMRSIRSIINMLKIPSLETREIILDLFFDVLKVDIPGWHREYIDGRRLTVIGPKAGHDLPGFKPLGEPRSSSSFDKINLAHQYISLLLLVFLNAGLMDALITILEESDAASNLPRKATLLIGELLQIANRVLPSSMAAQIQSLPRLFEFAADTNRLDHSRKVAATTLSSIDSFNRNRSRLQKPTVARSRQRANSVEDSVRRNQRQVEQAKIKMSMQIDDKTFQDLILKTQVMVQKEHTKWNLDALIDLIEGPLMNPKRLEEAFRVLKFGKRLMSFFHPFSHRFSALKALPSNMRYIRLGNALLTTLVSSSEGIKYLANEDPLLKQIVEGFVQLDSNREGSSSEPIFSKERIADTLSYGYLEMLGTLSKFSEGIELLERFKVFTSFYHITELRGREDLVKGIIENIDYTSGGHPRIVLSKALTSPDTHVRIFATEHLGLLIQSSNKATEWTLRLLLTQLYDPSVEVCELAVQVLEEACESMDVLELVVQMQPSLDHLGEIGHPLLLRFMSTSIGFRYLYKSGYIEREMDAWFHERNFQYVVHIEVYLAQTFGRPINELDDESTSLNGTVPPHFYGELAKTELGSQVLSDTNHFAEFAHFIRQHGLENEDFDLIIKLKSVLWAVGNVGAAVRGLPFLEDEGIIPYILDIAETSLVLSVRGTAFFVLGLIASTTQGAELLDEFDWEATLTPLGETTGLCIPLDIDAFVQIPAWECPAEVVSPALPPPENPMEVQILGAISNLQNTVIANEAARALTRFKSQHRAVFSSIPLFYRVLHILSTQRYRLPVRRYVLDLFDIDLEPEVMSSIYAYSQTLSASPSIHTTNSPISATRTSSANGVSQSSSGLGLSVGSASDELTDSSANSGGRPVTKARRLAPQQRPSGIKVPPTR